MAPPHTLLIVDDDAGNRELLRIYLGKKGYELREAEDGEQGLQMAQADDVHLVLLDQMMPRMGGVDVLIALRALGSKVPVILLTAVSDAESIVTAMEAGADDYVTKPFSLPVLAARIERRLRPADVWSAVVEVAEEQVVLEIEAPAAAPIAAPGEPSPTPTPSSSSSSGWASRLRGFRRRLLGEPAQTVQPGFVLDSRYRLDAPMSVGKRGTVWRARHIGLDTDVAIKVRHRDAPPLRNGESAIDGLRREAVLLARARHKNSVRAYDHGVAADGHAFLVLELLLGETARVRLVRERHLSVAVAFGIVADVCAALGAAHRLGVVHRDVKAWNVLLAVDDPDDAPVVKLCDFGAAASIDDPLAGEALIGTPSHMAPERFDDPRATPASDIYAAGVMLHHLVTGALPFLGADLVAMGRLHQANKPRLPSSHIEGLPAGVDDAVARLIRRNPAERPTAREAVKLLRSIARSQQDKERRQKR